MRYYIKNYEEFRDINPKVGNYIVIINQPNPTPNQPRLCTQCRSCNKCSTDEPLPQVLLGRILELQNNKNITDSGGKVIAEEDIAICVMLLPYRSEPPTIFAIFMKDELGDNLLYYGSDYETAKEVYLKKIKEFQFDL